MQMTRASDAGAQEGEGAQKDAGASNDAGAFGALCKAVTRAWPLQRFAELTTMVAVSGGADSVGLLRALLRLLGSEASRRLIVLHYNHRLRGPHSEADEAFVTALAASHGVECLVERAKRDPSPKLPGGRQWDGVDEASLRHQRYAFFDAVAHRRGARYVATAHTADDQVETLLHQLLRGTGPAGMTGIPPHRDLGIDVVLARPLLAVRREQIREALEEIAQPWREDASNGDERWQRNWIRGRLLPAIRSRYADADGAIARFARQQAELIEWLEADAQAWAARHLHASRGGPLRIELAPGGSEPASLPPRPVVIAALRRAWDECGWPRGAMSERHWHALAAAIAETAGAGASSGGALPIDLPGAVRVRRADPSTVVVAAIGGD